MNLPTYALTDEPPSSVRAVCLGVAPFASSKDDEAHKGGPSTPGGFDEFFGTANSDGWVVYRTWPLAVVQRHVVPNGGSLRFVVPLHRTNIVLLVGGPPSPLYAPNKVVLFDCALKEAVFSVEFSAPVLGLTARRDKLVVALRRRVFLLGLCPPACPGSVMEEAAWDTCDNDRGLVCLASGEDSRVLIIPGRQVGQVQMVHLPPFRSPTCPVVASSTAVQLPVCRATSILLAHHTALASLALTPSGSLIATASVTGTLIRIWDAATSRLVRELRRGTDGAHIWSLRFRPDGGAICASSDKGTVHLWNLVHKSPEDRAHANPQNKIQRHPVSLALLKPYLPKYFHSSWSDAFFRLPAPGPSSTRALFHLLASLPVGVSHRGPSSAGEGQGRAMFEQHRHPNPPRIEEDVSLVSWIMTAQGEPQVVVVTQSGSWYRLRVPDEVPQPSQHHHTPQPSVRGAEPFGSKLPPTAQQHTMNRLGIAQDKSVELECVEYQRFGEDEDWSDDDHP